MIRALDAAVELLSVLPLRHVSRSRVTVVVRTALALGDVTALLRDGLSFGRAVESVRK